MSRKSVEVPDSFVFAMDYDVLYSDVNNANHLGADRVLPIAMEAQLRFIKQLGYSDAVAFEDAGLIMVHSEVQYLAEAKYGDRLLVELAARHFGSKSFELVYRIRNRTRGNDTALVATPLLFFDYRREQVVAIPPLFLDRVHAARPL